MVMRGRFWRRMRTGLRTTIWSSRWKESVARWKEKKNFCPSHKTEEGSSCLTKLPKSTRDPNNLCPTTPSTIALRIPCSV
ncbi:hypothetical protein CGGC5_v006968 [Colletotrichum fructicola Nara gc5]|uniref:Uncharacterized protein n=1 Tax=Colletotrichum fructicola (strain Nara gc5) TaxID=1213859 RepID=A0A7J6J6K9_COLFN|nr:hypothetical protein CGGC5_v006968 [Colletotrichum fructicola Nara gc5]